MADGNQLSFGNGLLSSRRKISKLSKHLYKLDQIIDWQTLVREISIIDAKSTKKGGTYYFGYKGHIGMDMESKLIHKATFTPANEHDSTQTAN